MFFTLHNPPELMLSNDNKMKDVKGLVNLIMAFKLILEANQDTLVQYNKIRPTCDLLKLEDKLESKLLIIIRAENKAGNSRSHKCQYQVR